VEVTTQKESIATTMVQREVATTQKEAIMGKKAKQ
jgi:hypothetical protein